VKLIGPLSPPRAIALIMGMKKDSPLAFYRFVRERGDSIAYAVLCVIAAYDQEKRTLHDGAWARWKAKAEGKEERSIAS
jgi:alkylated DNA nucleotide flippase Atl1